MDRFEILNNINKITSSFEGQIPNIYVLHGELTEVEMNALFNHPKVKAHISFTHGEGYGHPLLLQTLSGKPVLVPDWSGHLDFMNPKYANLLQGQLIDVDKKSVNQWIIKESKWFKVSYGLAENKIKEIFHNKPKKVFENAELLRQENAEKFSMDSMDKRLWAILDQYVPKFAVENQFVLPKFTKSSGDTLSSGLPTLKI